MAQLTRQSPWAKLRLWRGSVLLLGGIYFAVPLGASIFFSIDNTKGGYSFRAYTDLISAPGFLDSLRLGMELALVTVAVMLLLLVPALVAVRLGAPGCARSSS